MTSKANSKVEFGDFQTPPQLAERICAFINRTGFSPTSVVEPTCGIGTFLGAALKEFPLATHFLGVDRDPDYISQAIAITNAEHSSKNIQILQSDFFHTKWSRLIAPLPKPILILGNPPWVTNAALGTFKGSNLPQKTNRDNLRGIDAMTGKSNFDISEWMIRHNLEWLGDSPGMLAILCKTIVARKVLAHAWSRHLSIGSAEIRRIDAKRYFGAAVDACLLIVKIQPDVTRQDCGDYDSLEASTPTTIFGMREGMLVADVHLFERHRFLLGRGLSGWRSGIKHDCSSVFELIRSGPGYENKLGEQVFIEEETVFPLLKSSDLAKHRQPNKWLLVPQRTVTESPELLKDLAPKAWEYLNGHSALLSKRGSSIYRKRPPFSIFGVGAYTFSPWKVGISGLYKKLDFVLIPPFKARPVVLDDTCYYFSCKTEQEGETLLKLVQSDAAHEFWSSLIFWDAKRPITAQILNLLDFKTLSHFADMGTDSTKDLADRQIVPYSEGTHQLILLRDKSESYSTDG